MKRIMIGGMLHESNMFSPVLTDLEAFRLRQIFYGEEMIGGRRNTNTEVGGFIDVLEKSGIEMAPSILGAAMPSGSVTEDAFNEFVGLFLDTLDRKPADGILLSLHGAMVGTEHDDGEGYILKKIRDKVGTKTPIVITLDFHATLTPMMASLADAITIYRTYPHMDMADRGREAADIMLRILDGKIHPVIALSKQALMIGPPHNVLPHDMPMKKIMDRAREMERELHGKIIAACPAQGFMQQDVPFAGTGVVVTAHDDLELAQKCADELGDMMFAHRHDYLVDLPDPAETIRMAKQSDDYPIAIADSGDNIGGGTPGDGTALLHEILKQGVDSAFVPLWDPEAAEYAAEKGVGSTVTLEVGGKSDPIYGPPVRITGVVRTVTDGVFMNREGGGYKAGVIDNMGLSVRIDAGGITIVLNSISTSPNNIMHANALGVYPEDYRMSICKGGLAFREAYKPPIIKSYIQSDTPGYSSSNLRNFTFTKIKRPMFPLDDI
ncbi:M81 family metallopeptidase [bacterium]|nr:M81 family metallopeptidase [bacterium]